MGDHAEETDSQIKPGEVIAGKYRIERLIGRGGMAQVYAAHHEILQQTVALKVLLPEIARSKEASARFLNEARSAARIRGEHVAAVMDVGMLPDGAAYLVLEYLEGRDLEAYADDHAPLPVSEAVDYVLDALQAIAQAHALGIVHRDIKPSNLFLARRADGTTVVKVLDFGISKASRSAGSMPIDAHATASSVILGSPYYIAPEQARSAKSVDPRADIWAIGVVLHRLLTGALPFVGETLTELLLAIVQDAPSPIRQLRAELPEALEALVLRCLRKNPAERFANVAELAGALMPFASRESMPAVLRVQRTLAVEPAPAAPVSAPPTAPSVAGPGAGTKSSWAEASAARNEKAARSSRGKLLAGGAVAMIGCALAVVALSRGKSESRAPAAAAGSAMPVVQEPAPAPSASSAGVQLAAPPPETADSVVAAASASAPTAPASVAATAAHPPVAAGRPLAAPPGPHSTPKTAPPAPSAGTYDLLNQRN